MHKVRIALIGSLALLSGCAKPHVATSVIPASVRLEVGERGPELTTVSTAGQTIGPPENFANKNRVLDEWCARLERNPAEIERTVAIQPNELDAVDAYLEAGADHIIVMTGHPFDLEPAERLFAATR